MELVINYNSFSWGQWRWIKQDVNILWDSKMGWEFQELSFWQIELQVSFPHPNWNITEACRNWSRCCGVIGGGRTSTVEYHLHSSDGEPMATDDEWMRWWDVDACPCQDKCPQRYDSNRLCAFTEIPTSDSVERRMSCRDVHRRGLRLLGQLPVCPPRLKLPLRRKYTYF